MTTFEAPDGWVDEGSTGDRGASLIAELRREVADGHVLFDLSVRLLGRCNGHCDDALFELDDGRVALVHLSYPPTGPDTPPWPITTLFDDVDAASEHLASHFEGE